MKKLFITAIAVIAIIAVTTAITGCKQPGVPSCNCPKNFGAKSETFTNTISVKVLRPNISSYNNEQKIYNYWGRVVHVGNGASQSNFSIIPYQNKATSHVFKNNSYPCGPSLLLDWLTGSNDFPLKRDYNDNDHFNSGYFDSIAKLVYFSPVPTYKNITKKELIQQLKTYHKVGNPQNLEQEIDKLFDSNYKAGEIGVLFYYSYYDNGSWSGLIGIFKW